MNVKEVLLINDRNGSIKLYYSFFDGKLIFSPKIKILLELGVNKQLRKDAIIDYLIFGYPLENKTLLKDIKELPPGSIIRYAEDKIEIKNYWNYLYQGEFYDRTNLDA